jgi:Flp pilus assembly protein TadG
MKVRTHSPARRGSILPLLAISLIALLALVALAVDIGMIAAARTQAQNAADAAAMTGARTLNGSSGNNADQATTNAVNIACQNKVLGDAVKVSEVTVTHNSYQYDNNPSSATYQSFQPASPAGPPYTMTTVTVSPKRTPGFAQVFGISTLDVSATASAAHRPRDTCIVLDYSGSMNNESDLWNNEAYLENVNNSPNTNDTRVPLFGHYSAANINIVNTSADPRVGKCNITQPALGISAMVDDYYQNARGSGTLTAAFTAAPANYGTVPGGDNYLTTSGNTTTTYAATVADIVGGTSRNANWELDGYSTYTGNLANQTDYSNVPFNGYTQGPAYFGKTFFIWPPDPRAGTATVTQVQAFLQDFGYTAAQLAATGGDPFVRGIFTPTTAPNSQAWP